MLKKLTDQGVALNDNLSAMYKYLQSIAEPKSQNTDAMKSPDPSHTTDTAKLVERLNVLLQAHRNDPANLELGQQLIGAAQCLLPQVDEQNLIRLLYLMYHVLKELTDQGVTLSSSLAELYEYFQQVQRLMNQDTEEPEIEVTIATKSPAPSQNADTAKLVLTYERLNALIQAHQVDPANVEIGQQLIVEAQRFGPQANEEDRNKLSNLIYQVVRTLNSHKVTLKDSLAETTNQSTTSSQYDETTDDAAKHQTNKNATNTTVVHFDPGKDFTTTIQLPAHNLHIDELHFLRLLARSISLTTDEKGRIIAAVPNLTQAQIDTIIAICEKEQQNFDNIRPEHQAVMAGLEAKTKAEWGKLEQELGTVPHQDTPVEPIEAAPQTISHTVSEEIAEPQAIAITTPLQPPLECFPEEIPTVHQAKYTAITFIAVLWVVIIGSIVLRYFL